MKLKTPSNLQVVTNKLDKIYHNVSIKYNVNIKYKCVYIHPHVNIKYNLSKTELNYIT